MRTLTGEIIAEWHARDADADKSELMAFVEQVRLLLELAPVCRLNIS